MYEDNHATGRGVFRVYFNGDQEPEYNTWVKYANEYRRDRISSNKLVYTTGSRPGGNRIVPMFMNECATVLTKRGFRGIKAWQDDI